MTVNLTNLLCYKLFYLVKLNEQLIDKKMAPLNLTRTQWKIMARFNFLPTPCTQQTLLTSMGIDCAHLTRTLEQLEQRGLITKERIRDDKRAYQIYPTSKGQKQVNKIEQILITESNTLVNDFTQSEITQLTTLIDKIESNILEEFKDLRDKNGKI